MRRNAPACTVIAAPSSRHRLDLGQDLAHVHLDHDDGLGVGASGPHQLRRKRPDRLELEDPEPLVPLVRNAGAVFLGPWSPASVGD